MTRRLGSLFSGYGGLELGIAQVLDVQPVWHSEIPAASRVLAQHWPDVPNHGDITAIDWTRVEPVDVLCGGFPCQDVSLAGGRVGLRDGTRTGLWAHMARAIDTLRPQLVVAENVRGLLSADADSDLEPCPWCVGDEPDHALRALGAVLGDLANLGYDARWRGLRAADVGAPHGRYRIFITAWPADTSGGLSTRRTAAVRESPVADTTRPERQRPQPADMAAATQPAAKSRECAGPTAWGHYGPAIRRWETVLGRPAPAPTITGQRGSPRLSGRFCEWLMGLPDGWITDTPGITNNDALRLAGNGVVPQQAAAALAHMFSRVGADSRTAGERVRL